jgi:membrane protease YdiL (CAAX protease family)
MSSPDPLSIPPDGAFAPPTPVPALPTELDLEGGAPGRGGPEVSALPLTVAPVPALEPVPVVVARPPHPNFWWGSLWSIGFFLFLNGMLVASLCALVVLKAALGPDPQGYLKSLAPHGDASQELIALLAPAYLVAELASVALAWGVVRLVVGRDWKRRLSVQPPSAGQLVLAIAGLPALLTVPGVVHALAAKVLPSLGNLEANQQLFGAWPLWFSVFAIGVLPGIGEELWCRGFLGRGFVGHYGWLSGVLLTSLWFGLLHVDPPYIVATFAMGIWLHYVYVTTRSLPLSMGLHALNNSLAVIFAKYEEVSKPLETATEHVVVLAAIGLLLVAVAWALFRGRARLVSTVDGGPASWRPAFPGVEAPPAFSRTAVARPGAGLLAWLLVAAAVAAFAVSLVLALQLGDLVP